MVNLFYQASEEEVYKVESMRGIGVRTGRRVRSVGVLAVRRRGGGDVGERREKCSVKVSEEGRAGRSSCGSGNRARMGQIF